MTNNKPAPKTPEDLIFEEVDDYNRISYIKAAEKELERANEGKEKIEKQGMLKGELEKYQDSFRNYYYTNQILSDNKASDFFDDAMRDVHPGVKMKGPAKNILKLVNKVFIQELAETCIEVLSQTKGEDVDQEVVEDAYRLMQKRRSKHSKFGKLFSGTN